MEAAAAEADGWRRRKTASREQNELHLGTADGHRLAQDLTGIENGVEGRADNGGAGWSGMGQMEESGEDSLWDVREEGWMIVKER